jgi:hypothetical protein
VSAAPTVVELGELRGAVAPLRAEFEALAKSDTPDPSATLAARSSFEALLARCGSSLSSGVSQRIRAALDDPADDQAALGRSLRVLEEVDAELAFREKVASYKRSPLRAALSILLWLLALPALAASVVSLVATLVASRISDFEDLVRQAFGALWFYGLLALFFASLGLALWRRGDPRPRTVTGRQAITAAALSLAALVASTAATTSGASLPILSASTRYEVGAVASVLPPGTTGWQAQSTHDELRDQVDFMRDIGRRQTAQDSETLRAHIIAVKATGNLVPATELIQGALDGLEGSREGGRLTLASFKASAVPTFQQCRRYDRIAKDSGVTQFPSSVFILVSHGLFCFVEAPAYLVTAEWSHRYLEGTTPFVSESDADAFLASLQLKATASSLRSPSALATTGRVVFAERFSDKNTGWTVFDNDFARAGYLSPTGYGVQLKRRAHAHVSTRTIETRRDAYIEVEAFVPEQQDAYYGPTCRVDDSFSSFYLFEVTSHGTYGITKFVAGKRTTIAHSVFAVRRSLLPPGTLRIAAYCYGEPGKSVTLALAVNGVSLLQIDDREPALDRAGRAAFFSNGETAGPQMRLLSFTIREIAH